MRHPTPVARLLDRYRRRRLVAVVGEHWRLGEGWAGIICNATVMQIGQYRFFFFRNEDREPAHIHIKASGDEAKFWLEPVQLATNHGFRARELNEIERLITQHLAQLVETWDEYFGE